MEICITSDLMEQLEQDEQNINEKTYYFNGDGVLQKE